MCSVLRVIIFIYGKKMYNIKCTTMYKISGGGRKSDNIITNFPKIHDFLQDLGIIMHEV